jgi:hypothetical protein
VVDELGALFIGLYEHQVTTMTQVQHVGRSGVHTERLSSWISGYRSTHNACYISVMLYRSRLVEWRKMAGGQKESV